MDDAMKHLPYEIDSLIWTFERYLRTDPADVKLKDTLIEAFCVHARLLFELFEKEKKRPRYTTGYCWVEDPTKYKKILNNQIMHLGFKERTTVVANMIAYSMRLDMLNRIRTEITHFKSVMTDRAIAATIPEVPPSTPVVFAPAVLTATGANQLTTTSGPTTEIHVVNSKHAP